MLFEYFLLATLFRWTPAMFPSKAADQPVMDFLLKNTGESLPVFQSVPQLRVATKHAQHGAKMSREKKGTIDFGS